MDKNYDIKYTGALRCKSVHLKSGTEIETDAPTDNNGKGEKFSPTDLVATALATCMLTVIGIYFKKRDRELKDIHCEVQKIMASNPRRIDSVKIDFDFGENNFTEKEFEKIHKVANTCPVANSLSKELTVETNLASFYSV